MEEKEDSVPIREILRKAVFAVFVLALLLPAACSRKQDRGEKVATVNGAPIYLDDFRREVSIASESDPDFRVNAKALERTLDGLIEKKLMIQEARKRGLTEDERFIETIKLFWEQTLIRRLIDEMSGEWAREIFVTDEEVRDHYEKMKYALKVRIAAADMDEEAEAFRERMLKGGRVEGEEELGPFLLEDVRPGYPVFNAFALEQGEAGIWEDGGRRLVIFVVEKRPAQVPDLAEVYGHIRAELLERKKEEAFNRWLKGVKESAEVKVDKSVLEKAADE